MPCSAEIEPPSLATIAWTQSFISLPAREIGERVRADRLAHVEMDVAVAEMAERDRPRARHERFDRGARLRDEVRHGRDRHGDVVLDRAALEFLRLGNELAQTPERVALLDALGDGRVARRRRARSRRRARPRARPRRLVARARLELDQHIPGIGVPPAGRAGPARGAIANSSGRRPISSKLVAAPPVASCVSVEKVERRGRARQARQRPSRSSSARETASAPPR